jgi:hypothetical protein
MTLIFSSSSSHSQNDSDTPYLILQFTGSKMRLMFKLMNEVGSQTSTTLRDQINNGANNKIEFKDLARKFAVDIIGTTAFGLEVIKTLLV